MTCVYGHVIITEGRMIRRQQRIQRARTQARRRVQQEQTHRDPVSSVVEAAVANIPTAAPPPSHQQRQRPRGPHHTQIDELAEKVAKTSDESDRFLATPIFTLPLYEALPHTDTQLRNVSGTVEQGKPYLVSYPQVDGACGLLFMKLWKIDPETAGITKMWVPFAVDEKSDGVDASEILGFPEGVYIFMEDCKFPGTT